MTLPPLHADGKHIKDELGNIVVLRGVNQAGMLDSPDGWWNPEGGGLWSGLGVWNPNAVKFNLDAMKSWGCNALRLTTTISWWIDDTSNYRQHIKDIITWADERGIYVIFCPYFVVNGPQPLLPYPPYIDESTGSDIITSEQDFVDYWAAVANELKDYQNVIFEIYNEPNGDDVAETGFKVVTQQWINAVRATGANQLLITFWEAVAANMSPGGWNKNWSGWIEDWALTDPLDNVVYSFHLYRGSLHKYVDLVRIEVYTYEDLVAGFQLCSVDYVLDTLNKPIYVGEIGANMWRSGSDLEDELAFFSNSLTIFNEWGISYTAWTWRDTMTGIRHGLLELTDDAWSCAPNIAGQTLINSFSMKKNKREKLSVKSWKRKSKFL